jgi:guanosine-3',5'-bis(diphosphate) 3'-pyrophosphohydrolase
MKANTNAPGIAGLLLAADFAAIKHRDQRRKDVEKAPYINHPLRVAALLSGAGGVTDHAILQAALLHDTVEDTATTPAELESLFGAGVRGLVAEVTDDKSLPKAERKRLQVEHASQLSPGARLIKLADKIANVTELTTTAPVGWPVDRKLGYVDWAEQVIAGMRGSNAALERLFDEVVAEKRALFSHPPVGGFRIAETTPAA